MGNLVVRDSSVRAMGTLVGRHRSVRAAGTLVVKKRSIRATRTLENIECQKHGCTGRDRSIRPKSMSVMRDSSMRQEDEDRNQHVETGGYREISAPWLVVVKIGKSVKMVFSLRHNHSISTAGE